MDIYLYENSKMGEFPRTANTFSLNFKIHLFGHTIAFKIFKCHFIE